MRHALMVLFLLLPVTAVSAQSDEFEGMEPEVSTAFYAVSRGDVSSVRQMLDADASLIGARSAFGDTLLHWAAVSGSLARRRHWSHGAPTSTPVTKHALPHCPWPSRRGR